MTAIENTGSPLKPFTFAQEELKQAAQGLAFTPTRWQQGWLNARQKLGFVAMMSAILIVCMSPVLFAIGTGATLSFSASYVYPLGLTAGMLLLLLWSLLGGILRKRYARRHWQGEARKAFAGYSTLLVAEGSRFEEWLKTYYGITSEEQAFRMGGKWGLPEVTFSTASASLANLAPVPTELSIGELKFMLPIKKLRASERYSLEELTPGEWLLVSHKVATTPLPQLEALTSNS